MVDGVVGPTLSHRESRRCGQCEPSDRTLDVSTVAYPGVSSRHDEDTDTEHQSYDTLAERSTPHLI